MEPPDLNQPEQPPAKRKYLAGSRGMDAILGIVTGFAWWGVGFAVAQSSRDKAPVVWVMVAFVLHFIVLGTRWPYMLRFVCWQLLTVCLVPVLAIGLLFGACLLGGMHI